LELFDVVGQFVKLGFGLLVQIFGVLVLPFFGVLLQADDETLGLELHGADDKGGLDFLDFLFGS